MSRKTNARKYNSAILLEALKSRPIRGVTCRGKKDGGGAQVQAIYSAQAFARAANVPYFHSPLRRVAHAPRFRWNWARDWEAAFGLSNGHPSARGAGKIVTVQRFIDGYTGPPPIVEAKHFHQVCDANPKCYAPLLDGFRSKCMLVNDAPNNTRVAAVHIRRGDVAIPGAAIEMRLTPMAANARAIETLQSIWPGIEVQVYSQGQPDDFAALPQGCHLNLDSDVFETLRAMINADVLITAKSSFSYVAALLSRGAVIYEPFWHSPLAHWTERLPDGSFDLDRPQG